MTNRRIDVTLGINADVTQAKKHLKELQTTLSTISNNQTSINMDDQLRAASAEATKLKAILATATAQNGSLDLTKFSESLKQGNTNLTTLKNNLQQLGPNGAKAFQQLTMSIQAAQVPVKRTNTLVNQMWTSLKNTAKWQISSSVLHGLVGSLQQAMGYAKDLNKNLNDIRIVSGQSIAQMEDFTKRANEAAKALSTTTNEYVKASLIYYQQGLGAKEIEKRTQATIKMANVTGQAAQAVSDQMTAIWNNFDDGTKSLEYYADVITALGAATASSSDEIAQGLEKFSAVAETIGLSYEYATSALATVTAETRQSADVVGTAFKTLFSRMQGLKLGETLEDGTTLNKYSAGLASVGINIKDSNGQLKEMDTILDEMGAKWDKLNKDQQVALAQTVGGIRQYNQLISLMDNWDTFKINLEIAETSQGTLEKQQSIYEESWEASSKRVKASLENLFNNIIDDDFFIDFNNGLEDAIDMVSMLVKSLGGVSGVLTTIGMLATRVFSTQIAQGINDLVGKSSYKTMVEEQNRLREQARIQNSELAQQMKSSGTMQGSMQAYSFKDQARDLELYYDKAKGLSEVDQAHIKILMDKKNQLREILEIQGKTIDDSNKRLATYKNDFSDLAFGKGNQVTNYINKQMHAKNSETLITDLDQNFLKDGEIKANNLKNLLASVRAEAKITGESISQTYGTGVANNLKRMGEALKEAEEAAKKADMTLEEYFKAPQGQGALTAIQELYGAIKQKSAGYATDARNMINNTELISAVMKKFSISEEEARGRLEAFTNEINEQSNENQELIARIRELLGVQEQMNGVFGRGADALKKYDPGLAFTSATSAVMGLASAFQAAKSAWDTFKNPDVTAFEKITSIMMSLSMVAMSLTNVWSQGAKFMEQMAILGAQDTASTLANAGAKAVQKEAIEEVNEERAKSVAVTEADTKTTDKNTISILKNSMKGIKKTLTKFSGVIVAAAIVAASVWAFKELDKAYKADEIASQKAAENAAKLAQAYEDTKSKYDDFKNTVSSYSEGVEGLKELERGTVEYTEKLMEANEQALELIKNAKDLEYTINEDGLIEITEENLEKARRAEMQKVIDAQGASFVAQQQSNQAKYQADITDFNRNKIKGTDQLTGDDWKTTGKGASAGATTGAVSGLAVGSIMAAKGMAIGAATGSAVPVVGTIIGAVVGILVGAIAGAVTAAVADKDQTAQEQEAINKLSSIKDDKTYTQVMAAFAKAGDDNEVTAEELDKLKNTLTDLDIDINDDKIIQELALNSDSLQELLDSNRENIKQADLQNKLIAKQLIANDSTLSDSEWAEALGENYGAEAVKKAEEKIRKELINSDFGKEGVSKASGANDQAKEYFERYAEAVGLTGAQLVDTKGTDNNRVYEYLNSAGERVEVSLDQMIDAIVSGEGNQAVIDQLISINSKINELMPNSPGAAKYFADKSFENVTENEMKQMLQGYIEDGELTNWEIEQVLDKYIGDGEGDGISQETRDKYFWSGATREEAIAEFRKDMSIYKEDFLKNSITSVKDAYNKIFEATGKDMDLTPATKKRIAKQLTQAFAVSGEEGIQTLSKFYDNLDPSNAEAFSNAINGIDWINSELSVSTLSNSFKNAGLNIQYADSQLATLINTLAPNKLNGVEGFTKAILDLKSLKSFEQGETISSDEYYSLSSNLQSYFTEMLDGTFQLTASALAFKEAVGEEEVGLIEQLKNDTENKIQLQQNTKNYLDKILNGEEDYYNFAKQHLYDTFKGATTEKEFNLLKFNADENGEGYSSFLNLQNNTDTTLSGYNAFLNLQNNTGATSDNYDVLAKEKMIEIETGIDLLQEIIDSSDMDAHAKLIEMESHFEETGMLNQEEYDFLSTQTRDRKEEIDSFMERDFTGEQKAMAQKYAFEAQSLDELNEMYEKGRIAREDWARAYETIKDRDLNLPTEEVEEYVDYLKDINKEGDNIPDTTEGIEDMAESIVRTNRGVKTLSENLPDWQEAMKGPDGKEKWDAYNQTREAVADVVDMDSSNISDEFINVNMSDITAAAQGNIDAINRLKAAAAADIVAQVKIEHPEMSNVIDETLGMIESLKLPDLEVGATINNENFETGLAQILNSGAMTMQQLQDVLSASDLKLEFDPQDAKVEYVKVDGGKTTAEVRTTTTEVSGGIDIPVYPSGEIISIPTVKQFTTVGFEEIDRPEQEVPVYNGGNLKVTKTGGGATGGTVHKPSTSGGGGGGKSSTPKKTKANDFGLDKEKVDNYAKAIQKNNKAYAENEKAARELAVAHMRINRGVETLSSNWENWSNILTDGTLLEQTEIAGELAEAMQDILNITEEDYALLPDDFVQKNMHLINQVKDGNMQALTQLRAEAGKEIIIRITGAEALDGELQELHNKIVEYQQTMPELSADATINDAGFIAMCEALIAKAGMTAAQIQAYFASMGYDIEIKQTESGVKIQSISLSGEHGSGIDVAKNAPSSGGGGGGGGGGGSNKPQYEDKRYAKDYIERYYELDKAINQAKQSLESMNKEMDLAWGADRITALQNANNQIKNNINLLKQKDEAVLKNYEQDKKEVADMGFTYDDKTGTITNYEEQMTARFDSWTPDMIDPEKVLVAGTEATASGDRNMAAVVAGTVGSGDKSKIAALLEGNPIAGNNGTEKKGNELTQDTLMNRTVEKIQQADETYELHTSILQEIADAEKEILTNNAKILSSIYEMQQEILDKSYELVDIAMEGLDFDNIYRDIESLVNFMSNNTSPFGKLNDNLKLNAEGILTNLAAVEKARAENKISESAYIEGLSTNFSEAANLREQILDFQNTFLSVLENISDVSEDMIDEQISKYERFTSTLEHYTNVLGLMGREDAQELSNIMIKNNQEVILKNLKANKTYYSSLEKDRQYYQEMYKQTTDDELKEMYRARLEETENLMTDVQQQVQEGTEQLFENTQKILDNNLILAKKKIDDIMAGDDYKTLESLTKHIDQQYELQDMYLTKTNQLYETNKMIREASLKIDQTDNEVTKKKYQDYIKYVKQLGNASKLSQIELSAAQKRFDILEAQIALEEAQNAKNNVRLTRDNEGNWGYVYTADQNNIAEAEQKVADAENALYNESIDNFKTYQQQRAQISAELINDLEALNEKRRSGELSEEDYKAEVERTKQFYYEKYENLVSFQEMSYNTYREMGVAEDNLFEETLMSLDEFKDNTENYLDEVTGVFDQWKEDNKEIATEVGGIYAELADSMGQPIEEVINKINGPDGSLAKALKEVGNSTDELTKKLIGGDGEIGLIQEMENARKTAQEAILGNTGYYEEAKGLIDGIMGVMKKIEEILKPYYAALQAKYGEEDLLKDPEKKGKGEGEETPENNANDTPDYSNGSGANGLGTGSLSDKELKGDSFVPEEYLPQLPYNTGYKNNIVNKELQNILSTDADIAKFSDKQKEQYQYLSENRKLDLAAYFDGEENIPEDNPIPWLMNRFDYILGNMTEYMEGRNNKAVEYMGNTYNTAEELTLAILREYQLIPKWVQSIDDFNKFIIHLLSNLDETRKLYRWDSRDTVTDQFYQKEVKYGGRVATEDESLATQYFVDSGTELFARTGVGAIKGDPQWLKRSEEYEKLRHALTLVNFGNNDLIETYYNFDTGGYTGEWGSEGKLAALHEKEIVLNKYDTENFLQAIEMVRSIADFIDRNASISALGLLDYGKIKTLSSTDKTIQQEVRIQAEFPNVQDHNEIKIALQDMINQSSQYVYRTTI